MHPSKSRVPFEQTDLADDDLRIIAEATDSNAEGRHNSVGQAICTAVRERLYHKSEAREGLKHVVPHFDQLARKYKKSPRSIRDALKVYNAHTPLFDCIEKDLTSVHQAEEIIDTVDQTSWPEAVMILSNHSEDSDLEIGPEDDYVGDEYLHERQRERARELSGFKDQKIAEQRKEAKKAERKSKRTEEADRRKKEREQRSAKIKALPKKDKLKRKTEPLSQPTNSADRGCDIATVEKVNDGGTLTPEQQAYHANNKARVDDPARMGAAATIGDGTTSDIQQRFREEQAEVEQIGAQQSIDEEKCDTRGGVNKTAEIAAPPAPATTADQANDHDPAAIEQPESRIRLRGLNRRPRATVSTSTPNSSPACTPCPMCSTGTRQRQSWSRRSSMPLSVASKAWRASHERALRPRCMPARRARP